MARLALVLPDPLDRLAWQDDGNREVVGTDFVDNWSQLFEVPGEDPGRWRRAAFPAGPPFQAPGWVIYEARLSDHGVVELRHVEYISVDHG